MEARQDYLSPLQQYLETLHAKIQQLDAGKIADYIPELSHARPEWFGIALATVDGHVYQVGETQQAFTMQSISKAITYGLALADHGLDKVLSKVGLEPSGDAFNSIRLQSESGQPFNPMINAGAIAVCGLIEERDAVSRVQRVLDTLERYVGHPLRINDAVFRSELETGHRNRAIAHLLRNFNILESDPDEVLDLYFKQCSIDINCRDLAMMAASLANNGVNPVTGLVTLESRYVDKVLSVMGSCGMYDYSGNWLYKVGMPAKSGVGGGIMAVLPGQFGLAIFSPLLDARGNSVRGIRVCEAISAEFGLHLYHAARSTSSTVLRVKYSAAQLRSRKARSIAQQEVLTEKGNCVCGYELQGDLLFGSTESVIRDIMHEATCRDYFIVDLRRIVGMDDASSRLLLECVRLLHSRNKHIFFTSTRDKYSFVRYLVKNTSKAISEQLFRFKDRDRALEWCEDCVLGTTGDASAMILSELEVQDICAGLSTEEIFTLRQVCKQIEFAADTIVFRRGDSAESMFFIVKGEFEVMLRVRSHSEKRLTTVSAGMIFGELAMLNRHKRTAEVRACDDAICYEVKFTDIPEDIRIKMLVNLAGILAAKLDQEAEEITALS